MNENKDWVVRCRVSGGVTGTREALLKSNGVTQYFATEAEAETEAKRLRIAMNNKYSIACFGYWAERASAWED